MASRRRRNTPRRDRWWEPGSCRESEVNKGRGDGEVGALSVMVASSPEKVRVPHEPIGILAANPSGDWSGRPVTFACLLTSLRCGKI